jgi:hypothetical protein
MVSPPLSRPIFVAPRATAPVRLAGSSAPANGTATLATPTVRVYRVSPSTPVDRTSVANTGTIGTTATGTALPSVGGVPIPLDQLLNLAPGLGFSYDYLAATTKNLGIEAIIDPITQHEIGLAESLPQVSPFGFFPFFGGGYGGYVQAPQEVQAQAPAPQVIVLEQPTAPSAAAAPAAAAPAAPLPDVGHLYLVQRDGTVTDAAAFSQQGNQIIYIDSDGARHSIGVDQIDIEATEQRNAARGMVIHITQ